VLRELLAAVDLEYLLDRVGMHAAVNWHDTLSLGAQPSPLSRLQRPVVLRMRPRPAASGVGRLPQGVVLCTCSK
jgi:hypothetical protein